MGRLEGKIAVVTGASRGIGEGIARLFAQEGAKMLLAARTGERLMSLAAEIEAAGGEAYPLVTDVSVTEDVRRMIETCAERFGGLDVLVNNAGIPSFSRTMDADDLEQEYDRLMDTNLKSVWMGIHYGLPHFRAKGGGSVINIASVHSIASGGHMSAYAASKGGMVGGTHALAVELAPLLIRVNCISPGTIWLNEPEEWLQKRLGPELYQEFKDRFGDWEVRSRQLKQPLPVAGRPVDVAYCAVYLASDESRFCTGGNYVVDGGMTAMLGDPYLVHPGMYELLQGEREVRAWIAEARKRAEASKEEDG
ncbi:MAG: glucose 1-dehydrogenase [Armatimonadetes bacterium]|nr:glucose 1-dehydrogenase [Armatimonadota bacterium]